jgi:hypothetical protein
MSLIESMRRPLSSKRLHGGRFSGNVNTRAMFFKRAGIDGGRRSIFAGALGASRFLMLMKFEVRLRESVDGRVSVDMAAKVQKS